MAKTNPIRLGIVGLGRAGWGMHCPELAGKERKFKIVAGCDTIADRRDRMAAKYGCATYGRIEDLLADDAVEMVAVATRSCDHHAHTILSLTAGKDVFLEKPICVTWSQAKRIRAASARAVGTVYVRHNRRCEPAFNQIREIIASRLLGRIVQVKLMRGGYARRDDWQTLKKYGGGQLLNWGPHIIDHGLRLLDGKVRRIAGYLARVAAVGDAEDHVKVILEGADGCVVDIEISGGVAIGSPEYLVWGTKGALECDGGTITLRYLAPGVKLERRRARANTPGATFGSAEKLKWIEKKIAVRRKESFNIWDALYAAVRSGKRFPITLDEAVQVMEVVSTVKKGTPFE